MKFGKRRKDEEPPAAEPVAVADAAPPEPVSSWTGSSGDNTVVGQQRPTFDEPPAADPVVEGSAEELLSQPPSADTVVGGIARPVDPDPEPVPVAFQKAPEFQPIPAPFPVAEEPVAVVTPGPEAPYVTPLGDAAEAASGHGPAPGPAWPEDVQKLASERPELVVGAAFVGGLLAAMILRRLGN